MIFFSLKKRLAMCALAVLWSVPVYAQSPSPDRNLQRYEVNQTFQGSAFLKDNNIWVYTKEFADLFGMPAKYIEDVQGIAAAAFRIEDTSYQRCGFGRNPDACQKIEECLIDLYFDESKNPLPWATDIKSQWKATYASVRWLPPANRAEKPHGMLAADAPSGVIRDKGRHGQIIPFADPVSKQEANFTSNVRDAPGDEEAVSGGMAIIGYMRNFYHGLSVVNLQFGCMTVGRKSINIRLDSKLNGPYGKPIARFNRVYLPEGFSQRIDGLLKSNSDKNAIFYRSLFAPPLGTKGVNSPIQPDTNP